MNKLNLKIGPQTKDYKLAFVVSLLSTQHLRVRLKIGWLGIRIMCLIAAVARHTNNCFSYLVQIKSDIIVIISS